MLFYGLYAWKSAVSSIIDFGQDIWNVRIPFNKCNNCISIECETLYFCCHSTPGFWLGKSSLRNWRKKVLHREEQNESRQDDPTKSDDIAGQADESAIEEIFNGELLCPHSDLSTNEGLRKLVSTEVWQRLRRYFPDAPEFDQDQQMCQICQVRTPSLTRTFTFKG